MRRICRGQPNYDEMNAEAPLVEVLSLLSNVRPHPACTDLLQGEHAMPGELRYTKGRSCMLKCSVEADDEMVIDFQIWLTEPSSALQDDCLCHLNIKVCAGGRAEL